MKLGTAVASATGQTGFYDVPFSMEFRLDQLDTYTDITSIADKYKLTSANVRICGPNTVSIQSAPLPYIEYVREEDDSVAPSVGDLNQKMGLRTTGFNQRGQCNMRFRPVPSGLLYNGGASSALAVPIRAPYINCSNPAVPHYAVKGVIRGFQANGSGTPSAFTVAVTLGVSVRDLQ